MTEQIRVVKSEWHQVEKRYGMVLSRDDVEAVYEEDEVEEKWQELIDGDLDPDEFRYEAESKEHYLDWEWLDEDDWWTDRKGGYEVTYEVEEYEPPKTTEDYMNELRDEVNELLVRLGEEPKYDTRDLNLRLDDLKAEFERLLDEEEDEEEWVEVGSEEWTEEMDKAAKAEDEVKSKT
jgi:hypothetical protein